MSVLPPEIWHSICWYLSSHDLSSLRLVERAISDVAAEYLIPCVHIETSLESLRALKSIADHPNLRKAVKAVSYEAGLLANIGCVHRYKTHYQANNHDHLPMPVPPTGANATPRAKRLWEREEKKFNAEIQARFDKYQSVLKEQQKIKNERQDLIISSLANFKLNRVMLKTGSICAHSLSQQFRRKYCNDCAIPLDTDPDNTVWQFSSLLVPGLTKLTAQHISLKIFRQEGGHTKEWLIDRFNSLQEICLEFKQGRLADGEPESFNISESWLPDAIQAASDSLKSLLVNFDLTYGHSDAGRFDDLITIELPNLRHLDINFLRSTEDTFIQILESMPKLESLFVAWIELTFGSWLSAAARLRGKLNLTDFIATGLLEDRTGSVITDYCDRDMWCDGERFTMTSALMLYVTDKEISSAHFDSEEEFEMFYNPFNRLEDFEDEEDLSFEMGPIDPSDFEDEDGSDSGSDQDESDEEMPDLVDDQKSAMDVD